MNNKAMSVLAIAVAAGLLLVYWMKTSGPGSAVAVKLPAGFTEGAKEGRGLFEAKCITCHGTNAAGTKQGPSLVHIYYEPNHHGDGAFQVAVRRGVRQHHWRFGNMPPVPGINRDQVALMTRYVRELQRANNLDVEKVLF